MTDKDDHKKSNNWSWKDFLPLILAFPIAIVVKMFIFTTYHVPTASMVPSILPGDHIIVEKWVFGSRFFNQNKSFRLPGWRTIQYGDILVFNVPKEDSIFHLNRGVNFYNWKHSQASSSSLDSKKDSFRYMPVPGRTPFVKRVIGLPGDEIQLTQNTLLINGRTTPQFNNCIQHYEIYFQNGNDYKHYKDSLYRIGEHIQMNRAERTISGIFSKKELAPLPPSVRITPRIFFPHPNLIPDDFTWVRSLAEADGILKIPYKGWTVRVDSGFIHQFGQIIRRFEGFRGKIKDHSIIKPDGNSIQMYTFRKNYYWALGDNRPYSVDSRAWGLIPQDHIIGITRRTFWSKSPELNFNEGFRWDRIWAKIDQ